MTHPGQNSIPPAFHSSDSDRPWLGIRNQPDGRGGAKEQSGGHRLSAVGCRPAFGGIGMKRMNRSFTAETPRTQSRIGVKNKPKPGLCVCFAGLEDSALPVSLSHYKCSPEWQRYVRYRVKLTIGSLLALLCSLTACLDRVTTVEISRDKLTINGDLIPTSPTRQHFAKILGQPSRVDKKGLGTVYVHDELGITFRTDPDSNAVTDMSFYGKDLLAVWSFAPQKTFKGFLRVSGSGIPFDKAIQGLRTLVPDLKEREMSFGNMYEATFGRRELSIYVDTKDGSIKTVTITFSKGEQSAGGIAP